MMSLRVSFWATVILFSLLLAACKEGEKAPATSVTQVAVPVPRTHFGEVHEGEASFYRATGRGNCSFDAAEDRMVAAINKQDYADAALCGAHVEVSGPNGSVVVRVTDRCPGCKPGGLDLSREAFAHIAPLSAGRVSVRWQLVPGEMEGGVVYQYKAGSSRHWAAVQLRNHRWPVKTLEVMPAEGAEWVALERRAHNYFVLGKSLESGSVRLRATAVTGDIIEETLPAPGKLLAHAGMAQFPH